MANKIESPDMTFELPFKKDSMGDYMIFPKHIGGKNCLRKLAESNTPEGYIYFIKISGTNKYKIGVSAKPQRRLRDIASYIPFELQCLSVHYVKNPYQYEQAILDKYKKQLIKNEWFEFDIDTAKDIMIELHNRQVYESRETKKHENA